MGRKAKEEPARDGFGTALRRFVITLLVLALMIYVAGFFLVRTEGFRYMVQERLTEAFGLSVTVGHTAWLPDGTLVLEDVVTAGFDGGAGGMVTGWQCDRVRLQWHIWDALMPGRGVLRRIEVLGGRVQFGADASDAGFDGGSRFAFAGDVALLAEWLGRPLPLTATPRLLDGETAVVLEDLDLYWVDAVQPVVRASLEGVAFQRVSRSLLDLELTYRRVSARRVFVNGMVETGVERRLLETETGGVMFRGGVTPSVL